MVVLVRDTLYDRVTLVRSWWSCVSYRKCRKNITSTATIWFHFIIIIRWYSPDGYQSIQILSAIKGCCYTSIFGFYTALCSVTLIIVKAGLSSKVCVRYKTLSSNPKHWRRNKVLYRRFWCFLKRVFYYMDKGNK